MSTTEEIVLQKSAGVALRLVQQGRQRDAEVVLAAATLVADILAAEFGRAPHVDAGLVWDGGQARYIAVEKPTPAEDLDPTGLGDTGTATVLLSADATQVVDAVSGAMTITLPTRVVEGTTLRVERRDAPYPSCPPLCESVLDELQCSFAECMEPVCPDHEDDVRRCHAGPHHEEHSCLECYAEDQYSHQEHYGRKP